VEANVTTPTVFISYSHDSDSHKTWVLRLATDLRSAGVNVVLDRWDLALGEDVSMYMQKGISESDRVLMICTESYVAKAEEGTGGVGFERLIVTKEVVDTIDTKKFIPVIRGKGSNKATPSFLGPRLYIDFSKDNDYASKLEELLREIHGTPATEKPPLGQNPFSGALSKAVEPERVVGPTGRVASGSSILDDRWFATAQEEASAGLAQVDREAHMELRFALHEPINKSQIDLLNAVQESKIRTFGWPIGVTINNKEEFRPRPTSEGIRAEISITGESNEHTSYDYWAMRASGDFYLLQSLFEDERPENEIFFNTRIVRVTEALMFAANLYENLGAAAASDLSVRIAHRGFAGRHLTASSSRRHTMLAHVSQTGESEVERMMQVGSIRSSMAETVKQVLAPMFMLFDFQQFDDLIYEDIVTRFMNGEVS
jgi:hypothetical protein